MIGAMKRHHPDRGSGLGVSSRLSEPHPLRHAACSRHATDALHRKGPSKTDSHDRAALARAGRRFFEVMVRAPDESLMEARVC